MTTTTTTNNNNNTHKHKHNRNTSNISNKDLLAGLEGWRVRFMFVLFFWRRVGGLDRHKGH